MQPDSPAQPQAALIQTLEALNQATAALEYFGKLAFDRCDRDGIATAAVALGEVRAAAAELLRPGLGELVTMMTLRVTRHLCYIDGRIHDNRVLGWRLEALTPIDYPMVEAVQTAAGFPAALHDFFSLYITKTGRGCYRAIWCCNAGVSDPT